MVGMSLGCLPNLEGAPCDRDEDCPSQQFCAAKACAIGVRPRPSPDAGADAGLDVGVDAGIDAGVDAKLDAGVDARLDAGADAGLDLGVDAGIDAGVDAGLDAGVCHPGEGRACAGGPGTCSGGSQTCQGSGTWGACLGAPDACDCAQGDTRSCSAIAGAFPCGTASCAQGRWNTSSCTGVKEWCLDQDGDGYCAPNATCLLACSAPSGTSRESCPKTDCDDNAGSINPTTPLSCTAATSCVEQVVSYSSAKSACSCSPTAAPANEGVTCEPNKVCESGACACNSGGSCVDGCRAGKVNCVFGAVCQTTEDAPAGTPCGTGDGHMCNGANVCWSGCTLGLPKCAVGSCIGGSIRITCNEGGFCHISYKPAGAVCEVTGTCDAQGTCVH